MFDHIETIFENRKQLMKRLKPESYQTNMKQFRNRYANYFDEMVKFVEKAGDEEQKKEAAFEIGHILAYSVKKEFATRRTGKIKPNLQMDLNFFMIYYVFPAILLTEHPDVETVVRGICTVWGDFFEDSKIGYTDYESIYGGFRKKILGLF
ncbi:MAG: hypothetical protein LUF92_16830 [Clostridiales bacterium]|nr:hypothetical protein [Clostridiales bacterium]